MTNCVSLEEFGISRLSEVKRRRKHNFSDLIINDNGDIDVDDEETDENFNLSSEDVNLNESPIRKSSFIRLFTSDNNLHFSVFVRNMVVF